jgi:hypothetical protein
MRHTILPRRSRWPLGIVLWRGRSLLTGQPIVAILTGLRNPSENAKTGPMFQVWILRTRVAPHDAVNRGEDGAVCGVGKTRCPYAGGKGCYVNVGQGPRQVYVTFKRGGYEEYNPARHNPYLRGSRIRFGAYGDPASVPLRVFSPLARMARRWTGYTHQWKNPRIHSGWKRYVMASTHGPLDTQRARAAGWTTFRIVRNEAELVGERVCPASKEGGEVVQCIGCCACDGNHGHRAIVNHGSSVTLAILDKNMAIPA